MRILSCAEREFSEAVGYCNRQRAGLGFEFAAEVKSTLDRIAAFPDAWPAFSRRTRRCMVSRFPYGILYQARPDGILVIAIMHLAQAPKRWQDRLEESGSGT